MPHHQGMTPRRPACPHSCSSFCPTRPADAHCNVSCGSTCGRTCCDFKERGELRAKCPTIPDPPAPNCPPAVSARFALVLYGSVGPSSSSPYTKADQMFRLGRNLPASAFADVARVRLHFDAYLLEPSGGQEAWDTFIHSTVPSLEVQQLLLRVHRPLSHRFANYTHSWLPRISAICNPRCQARGGHVEVSRYLSAAAALGLVRKAEESHGRTYRAVYLTRLDVLLWAVVDLRTYCVGRNQGEVAYTDHCHPPHVTTHGAGGAPADYHFVLSSRHARAFANVTQHFARFDFFLGSPRPPRPPQ